MIINHLNTFPYGGAATAALRLHRQMRQTGLESKFLYEKSEREIIEGDGIQKIEWVANNNGADNPIRRVFEKRRIRKIYQQFDSHLAGRNKDLEVFSMPQLTDRTRLNQQSKCDQLFHLHWIAFMVDFPSFFNSVPSQSPIVWTLHDMNPLTGGCHYSNGCDRFKNGCGSCPQIKNPKPRDVSFHGFKTKKMAFRRRQLAIVTPSRWLKNLAQSSPIFPESTTFHHIRLGFDLNELFPVDKQRARKQIGLNTEKVVIGFGAESINNQRKGLDLLLDALSQLPDKTKVECAVFGTGDINQPGFDLPKTHSMGFINDPSRLANFYSACDFVVVPSREDNQPQVGLESMACGTPVVGFDVGGISEYVQPGITGRLAKAESGDDLASQIRDLIDDSENRKFMSQQCRQMMERDFDIVKQSQQYVDLYTELLQSRQRRISA